MCVSKRLKSWFVEIVLTTSLCLVMATIGIVTSDRCMGAQAATLYSGLASSTLAADESPSDAQTTTESNIYAEPGSYATNSYYCAPSRWYVQADALFLSRDNKSGNQAVVVDDGDNALISTGDLNFNYDPGVRLTFGLHRGPCACCDAWEFTYLGVFESDASSQVTGTNNIHAAGDIGNNVNGLTLSELIRVDYSSELNSFEANCFKCWREYSLGCRTRRLDYLVGFRYLSLDEDFRIYGHNVGVADATYNIDTDNHLYGFQVGARLRTERPRWAWEVLGKAGVYGNDSSQSQTIVDEIPANPVTFRDSGAGGSTTAFVGELGITGIYPLNDVWGLRGGYTLMWIDGVALAPDQLDFSFPGPANANALNNDGSLFLHGFTLGVEANW